MTLTEFLTARIDEDATAAKACQSPSPWKAATHPSDHWIVTDATGDALIYDEGTPTLEEAAHIALHDPARVLREVEAKRKILARYGELLAERKAHPGDVALAGALLALYGVIRGDCAVYSDHPDYREEWTP